MTGVIRQSIIFRNAAAACLGGLVFILSFITTVELDTRQLVAVIAGGAALLFLCTGPIQYGTNELFYRPFFRYLRCKERGTQPDLVELESAYRAVLAFPLKSALVSLALWTLPPALFVFVFLDRFGVPLRQQVYLWCALANAGLVAFVLQYYLFKRALAPAARELAADLPRLPLVSSAEASVLSIRSKIFVSFLSLLSFSLVFLSLLSFGAFERVYLRHVVRLGTDEISTLALGLETVRGASSEDWTGALRTAQVTGGGRLFLLDMEGAPMMGPATAVPALKPGEAWSNITAGEILVARRVEDPPVVIGAAYPRAGFTGLQASFALAVAAVGLFTLLFGWAVAYLLGRDISLPIRRLTYVVSRAARGKLADEPPLLSEDEVGDLSRSVREMVGRMRSQFRLVHAGALGLIAAARRTYGSARAIHMQSDGQLLDAEDAEKVSGLVASNSDLMAEEAGSLKRAAGDLLAFCAQLVEGMDRVEQSGLELAGSTRDFLPAVERIFELANQTNAQAQELARFSSETAAATSQAFMSARNVERIAMEGASLIQRVRETAERGEAAMRGVASGMEGIRSAGRRILELIEELDALFREVRWIVQLIGEVAEDADTLALNAEIISEQVGARGGGFSIVAREVGNLAGDTQDYTRTVTTRLEHIEKMEKQTLTKVEDMNRAIEEAIAHATELSGTFQRMLEHAKTNAAVALEIANACREQAVGSERITTAMVQMNRMVERISEDAQQQRTACERLRLSVERLREGSEHLAAGSRDQKATSEEARGLIEPLVTVVEAISSETQEQREAMGKFRSTVSEMTRLAFGNARTTDGLEEACSRIQARAQALASESGRIRLEDA
ncbi:MAG: methyl-accepting chemotaxis protein [Nitrospirae bacterium]|nr:methyl-accepting chemotaxis protein [Nitrospirota bacterium]